MRFFAVVAALVSAVAAETFTVVVGGNTSLTYNPTSVNAAEGDTIQFQFVSKNHTVTQSTFAAPCTSMAGGVNSDYQPVAANSTSFPVWSMTLTNASAPLWFYCEQTGHCAKGMVFAINPTAAKSFDAFQQAALATNSSSANSTTTTSGNSTASASGSASSSASSSGSKGSKSSGTSTETSASASDAATAAIGGASASASAPANGAVASTIHAAGLVTIFSVVAGLLL